MMLLTDSGPVRWIANFVMVATLVTSFDSLGRLALAREPDEPAPQLSGAEQKFADLLTKSVLVGSYTIDGQPVAPKKDRYEISTVKKIDGRKWEITARIQYGKNDLNVPVIVEMDWANDTPVLSMTGADVPLLGTFSTRLLFEGNRYAGTWQHDNVGGHMWGMIERAKTAP